MSCIYVTPFVWNWHDRLSPNSDFASKVPFPPPHLDILLPRHEDEDVSHQSTEVNLQGLFYCCLHIVLLRRLHSNTTTQSHFMCILFHIFHGKNFLKCCVTRMEAYLTKQDVYWKGSPWNMKYGDIAKKSCKLVWVHSCRCNDEFQIGSSGHNLVGNSRRKRHQSKMDAWHHPSVHTEISTGNNDIQVKWIIVLQSRHSCRSWNYKI